MLHVMTDEGIEGTCTVGDVRYTVMPRDVLDQLRLLAVGADPLERQHLYGKTRAATRSMFVPPGWSGAFDNCLWDIAGKAAGLPAHRLIGQARKSGPAYYNIRGDIGRVGGRGLAQRPSKRGSPRSRTTSASMRTGTSSGCARCAPRWAPAST